MNGRGGPLRRIESRPFHGPKASKLDLFEDDERAFLGGSVNTPARDFHAPKSEGARGFVIAATNAIVQRGQQYLRTNGI